VQTPAYLDRRWRIPGLGLTAALALAGCVADFDGLLEPGCTQDEDCPSVAAPCIDSRCDDGGCLLEVRSCDDGNACTMDRCDSGSDECVHDELPDGTECEANAVCAAGTCECIDGFDDCDDEPGCEAHLASDPKHCHRCDFECPAGQSCIQAMCGTCTDDGDCDDLKVCTIDACLMDGTCQHSLEDDACLISGQCREAGELRTDNRCQSCQPDVSQGTWTNVRDGTACDEANPCAVCQEGVCKESDGGDTDCCRPPHCRDFLGICRLPMDGECLDANGMCCSAANLGGCECVA
jgi:hypothetical protein